jgi:magnesium transporter
LPVAWIDLLGTIRTAFAAGRTGLSRSRAGRLAGGHAGQHGCRAPTDPHRNPMAIHGRPSPVRWTRSPERATHGATLTTPGPIMLAVYVPQGASLERKTVEHLAEIPENAVWFDLVSPTLREDKLVERVLGIAVPTREEMQEIEVTSRLYVENGARYMTATLMCQSDTATPKTTAVTFILAGNRLVTVRYDEPRPFTIVSGKLARLCPPTITGPSVLMEVLDAVIDRAADILERIGTEVDEVSHDIFEPKGSAAQRSRVYKDLLTTIGRKGDLTSKVRESLVSIGRLLLFLVNEAEPLRLPKEARAQLKGMQRDVQSLSDHSAYLSNKITFELDAVLGMVSLEQNNIIKIFSVAAVVFMPPTLVASIYGMNFKYMPELDWIAGYPTALALMLIAAVVPYLFFKWRKWL